MNKFSTRNYLLAASLVSTFLFLVISMSRGTVAQETKPSTQSAKSNAGAAGNNADVARGKYLVEDVAFCINCHTPRNQNGQLDRSKLLQGTPLFFRPAQPISDWPIIAPRIGGTPPATDAEMVTLLTTGIWITGVPLRDPMPKFHMTRQDAEAVVAYLKSLKSAH